MNKFPENYNPPKLSEKEAESLNRLITASEIDAAIKELPAHKSLGKDVFRGEFYKIFREEITPILYFLKLFKKCKK